MSRRRPAPRRTTGPSALAALSQQVVVKADGEWVVRRVSGSATAKAYRCPGCDHLIRPATPHTVVWPVEKSLLAAEAIDERRHWHSACWNRKH